MGKLEVIDLRKPAVNNIIGTLHAPTPVKGELVSTITTIKNSNYLRKAKLKSRPSEVDDKTFYETCSVSTKRLQF